MELETDTGHAYIPMKDFQKTEEKISETVSTGIKINGYCVGGSYCVSSYDGLERTHSYQRTHEYRSQKH